MKIKIVLEKITEVVTCDKVEVTQKFLKLTNVTIPDLLNSSCKEKNYKLTSVISYEIIS